MEPLFCFLPGERVLACVRLSGDLALCGRQGKTLSELGVDEMHADGVCTVCHNRSLGVPQVPNSLDAPTAAPSKIVRK